LVDALPHPDQEGFYVELAAFLQGLVQLRVLFGFVLVDVLVEHDAEYWEHCVDGRVAQHQVPVVDGDGD
jgi:hypothetical protein